MSSSTLVPVAEYLATNFRPDRDYVDGLIQERNVGEWPHSRTQARLCAYLFQKEQEWRIRVVTEQRVQVTATRFRVPDVTVILASDPMTAILTAPPFLCIEILSKDDTVSDLNERIGDYLRLGVKFVWVIDPLARQAFVYTPGKIEEVQDGILRTTEGSVSAPLDVILKLD
jgi:Uma2 family endonuclease